jgi:hypothetical protein
MIEDKRRSRRLQNRGIGVMPKSSPALSKSATPAEIDRPRRPKLKLKIPSDAPPGDA